MPARADALKLAMGPTPNTRSRNRALRIEPPPLLQFVLLSLLLHMLIVLLFGTTNYSNARRGDGMFGTLDVTLQEISPERGSGFTLAPGADTPLPGAALLRRLEGLSIAPAALPKHDAAQSAPTSPPVAAPALPAPAEQAIPDATLSNRPSPAETLPHLDRSAPVEVDKPLVAPTPAPVPVPAPQIVAPAPAPPREIVLPSAPPIDRLAPAKIEQLVTPRIELKPREIPTPAAVPLEPIAPAKIERQPTPPVELPAPASPATPQVVPRSESAETAPVRERPAPPAAAPSTPAPSKAVPAPSRSETTPGGELPRLRYGTPNVDQEVFGSRRDVAAPTPDTEGKPAITADSLRKRASEIAREGSGSRGVLNLVPPPPPVERKDKLAEDMAKAAKPDCRTAYAEMGLLAIAPLVASTVGNGGCRW